MCITTVRNHIKIFTCFHFVFDLYFSTIFIGIEDLREKREELNRSILRDEEEKAKIQKVSSFMNIIIINYYNVRIKNVDRYV